jgi:hypothetical protein
MVDSESLNYNFEETNPLNYKRKYTNFPNMKYGSKNDMNYKSTPLNRATVNYQNPSMRSEFEEIEIVEYTDEVIMKISGNWKNGKLNGKGKIEIPNKKFS